MGKKLMLAGILVLLLIALVVLVGISATIMFIMAEEGSLPPTSDPYINPPTNKYAEKGLSRQDAVVINEDYSEEGIPAEYDWLKANGCPNNGGVVEVEMQELDEDEEHLYDVLHTVCADGTKKQYYFNIDNFFGNWKEMPGLS